MDILYIDQLSIMTIIGVDDWEKIKKQQLILDVDIKWDHRKAALSDNVSDCLNYSDVVSSIITLVSEGKFALIERVAEEVATMLLQKYSLKWIRIKVSKSGAVPQARQVGIVIERSNLV
ncbi:dihydroneopterin aldolase [Candidatus Erwinia haradaeae]|uniref:7,8-dihydroneopterin aldolase n=1 Tax=Candidatus Erwinia haradaeae TaxID=1922217 RepID=A0A451D8E7_9GAMM|nr:dihydroneopterin aldolase [Candidatus Erwinia haradaeae]VFP81974.1 Dihydroneopterin aldolase [Candidatus Erwinia haradaeae]